MLRRNADRKEDNKEEKKQPVKHVEKDNIFSSDIKVDVPTSLDEIKKELEGILFLFIEKKKKENAPKNTNPEPGMLGNSGTGEAVPGMMPGMNPAMMAGMNPAMMAGMDPAMMAGMDPAMMAGMGGMEGMDSMAMLSAMMGGMGMEGGMPPMGAEGKNPFDAPQMTEDDIKKFEILQVFNMKLLENKATPEDIVEAKKMIGEAEIDEILKQYNEMPEEEKKAMLEYKNLYTSMTKNLETSFKEQGIDTKNPDMNPDDFMKGMTGMFTKFVDEQKDNPQFQAMMNSLGETVYNKEIIYPPLKQLMDAYPAWLEKNFLY